MISLSTGNQKVGGEVLASSNWCAHSLPQSSSSAWEEVKVKVLLTSLAAVVIILTGCHVIIGSDQLSNGRRGLRFLVAVSINL